MVYYKLGKVWGCSGDCVSWNMAIVTFLGTVAYGLIILGLCWCVIWLIKKGIDKYIDSRIKEKCRKKN